MSTISATQRFGLSVMETFTEAELPAAKNRTIVDDQFGSSVKLDAASTPPATKAWSAKGTSTQTIDLTVLDRSVGPSINASGLRLQMLLLNNLSATASLMIDKGASNGYPINGSSEGLVVPPSGSAQLYFADGLADVASGAKTLDVTVTPAGSGVEVEDFEIQLVFG